MLARHSLKSLLLLCLVLLASQGCSSSMAVFRCEPGVEINDGLELSIDLLVVSDGEEQQIRQLGDDWFYSDLRRSLGSRRTTVSVASNCSDKSVVVPKVKDFQRLAIIADYKFEGQGRAKTQMYFYGKDYWQGKTLRVRVFDRNLNISQGR